MKKYLILPLYLFNTLFCSAQTFEWAKAGNTGAASKMVRDKTGNFYVANGQGLAKYEPTGNFVWQKNITGFGINGIAVDNIGNLYIAGLFYGTVTLDNFNLTSDSGNNNMYIAKFNPRGTVQWISRSHNSAYFSNNISLDAITINEQGNPILIGRFLDSLHLDSYVFDAPETNQVYLATYSSEGVCLWAKHLKSWTFQGGGNGPEISSDKLGNTFISGNFLNYILFDSIKLLSHHFYSEYDDDIFLAKIDASGKLLWIRGLGGNSQEESGAMDVDSLGNTYLSGYFSSSPAYFGKYTLFTNSESYFTAKYDAQGNCLWVKYGNTGTFCAANDGYYTKVPGFISKYDALGVLQWTKDVSGANNYAMVNGNDAVYITGSYNGTVNFDTISLISTSPKMFIAKLNDPFGIIPTVTITMEGKTALCQGDSVTLTASITDGNSPFTYLWSPGGETNTSIRVSPTVTTTYTVLLKANNGSVGIDTILVKVYPASTANAGANQTISAGSNIILNGSLGGSATSAVWSGGLGTYNPNAITLNVEYIPSADEIKIGYVTLILTPIGSCVASNDEIVVKINPPMSTNIMEQQYTKSLTVYPNPATSIFTVTITSTKPQKEFTLRVINYSGQAVYSETMKEFSGSITKQIDLSSMPKGIYLLELSASFLNQQKQTREIQKIVLQ